MTIKITPRQASALRKVYRSYTDLAEKSPTIAALLDIESTDIELVEEFLFTLPKTPAENGRDHKPLPSLVRPTNQTNTSNYTVAEVANSSLAHVHI